MGYLDRKKSNDLLNTREEKSAFYGIGAVLRFSIAFSFQQIWECPILFQYWQLANSMLLVGRLFCLVISSVCNYPLTILSRVLVQIFEQSASSIFCFSYIKGRQRRRRRSIISLNEHLTWSPKMLSLIFLSFKAYFATICTEQLTLFKPNSI